MRALSPPGPANVVIYYINVVYECTASKSSLEENGLGEINPVMSRVQFGWGWFTFETLQFKEKVGHPLFFFVVLGTWVHMIPQQQPSLYCPLMTSCIWTAMGCLGLLFFNSSNTWSKSIILSLLNHVNNAMHCGLSG